MTHPYLSTNQYALLNGIPEPKEEPSKFDSMSAQIIFRGTPAQLKAVFGLGQNPPAGFVSRPSMYVTKSDITRREPDGHIWADVEWQGFATPGDRIRVYSNSVTTRETTWPQQSGDATVFVPASMLKVPFGSATSDTNPNTGEYWRVRLMDQLGLLRIQGASIATIYNPPVPPTVPSQIKPLNRPMNFSGLKDPVLNSPRGWVLVGYNPQDPIVVPRPGVPVGLFLWEANYQWVPDYGPG